MQNVILFSHMEVHWTPDGEPWRYLAATSSGSIVGIAVFSCYSNEPRKIAEVHELGVHEDFQNRGLGRSLLKRVEKVAREQGCEAVALYINEHNNIATNVAQFYESCGYVEGTKLAAKSYFTKELK